MLPKNKKLYYGLTGVLLLLGFFFFYWKLKSSPESTQNPYSYTTSSLGKKITVEAVTGVGTSTGSTRIVTEGFGTNIPITINKEKIRDVFFTDLNSDSFEEIVLVFNRVGGDGSEDAFIFTTYYENELTPVELPVITESEMLPGMAFEGYEGGDTFIEEGGVIFRDFYIKNEVDVEKNTDDEEVLEEQEDETTAISSETKDVSTTIPTEKKRKRIFYSLLFSEGLFYLEPQTISVAKVYTASSTARLENTSWKWLSLNSKGRVTRPETLGDSVISFYEDGTFNASSSCENFAGNYITSGYQLRLGVTPAVIPNEELPCTTPMEQLQKTLALSGSFILIDNQLTISLENNKGIIIFIRE